MPVPRVVITGIGAVSPFGVGRESFWEGVSHGRSGTRAITDFDAERLTCRVAAPVPAEALVDASANGAEGAGDEGRGRARRSASLREGVAHRRARGA